MQTQPPQALRICRAQQNDAAKIAALGEKTFFESFAKDNDLKDMHSYLSQAFTTAQIRMEMAEVGSVFLLAYKGQDICGYAKTQIGKADTSTFGPNPIELMRLYVDGSHQRSGVGAILIRRVIEMGIEDGYQTMWLGVWEKNVQAQKFYQRHGFDVVGKKQFVLGQDVQTDLIMTRALSHTASH